MTVEIQKFVRGAITLHYTIQGQGTPVVLIPGSISDMRCWTHQMEDFAKAHQIIAVSRRFQYPASPAADSDNSIDANTEDIIALLQHLGIKEADFIGHAYGGAIALNLACRYPKQVKRLAVVEPLLVSMLMSDSHNQLHKLLALAKNKKAAGSFMNFESKGVQTACKALAEGDLEAAKRAYIQPLQGDKKDFEELDGLIKQLLDDNMASYSGEDVANHNLQLGEISCPAMLINGDQSPPFFNYINQRLAKGIRQGIQVTINNAGHWVHIDQKRAFNDFVLNYLKD